MIIKQIPLELIDDNPYNPRKHYAQVKVKEMAQSLLENGLRQVPEGREINGRVQLAYGHMRLRGFLQNQKKEPEKWKEMPVNIKEISDQDMFHFAMEENLRRTDITPIELARCIEAFSQMFPDVLDEDIAKKHNMTAANVSNMKRVLRLPEKIQEKIDAGTISFTQGRELLVFEGFENAENLMKAAIDSLKIGNKTYGEPNTVEGLQKSIHNVFSNHYRPLDKEYQGYHWDILFDTRATECLQCAKMVRTHPTKSATAHYCTDEKCWDLHQEEHRDKAAADAKARMEAEIARRAAEANISQEKLKKDLEGQVDERDRQLDAEAERVAAEKETSEYQEVLVDADLMAKVEASYSGDRISEGQPLKKPFEFEGKHYINTGGTSGEWGCYQLVNVEEFKGETRTYGVPQGREDEEYYESLRNDPMGFYHGMLVNKGAKVLVGPEITFRLKEASKAQTEVPTKEIPAEVLEQAKKAAGTRAEVLDVHPLYSDDWRHELKGGFVLLSDVIREMDDSQECLERCVNGFHYAFDSGHLDRTGLAVCTDPKCVSKKKAALTRKKNAEGQARKKAEQKAIQIALSNTTAIGRNELKVILLCQVSGSHIATYYGGNETKKPEKWLWDKLSAGTPDLKRDIDLLFKKIDGLDDLQLARLVMELMFYYLVDHGDVAHYKTKTDLPLKWLGVEIELPQETTVMEKV